MILNPERKVAIDLQAWHYWWPWLPVQLNTGEWRWFYAVLRKRIYRECGHLFFWLRDDFKDIRGKA